MDDRIVHVGRMERTHMKMKFLVLGLLLTAGASMQAATSFTLNSLASQGTLVQDGTGNYIGPYTGSLGGTAVTLFCDDYNDAVAFGSTFNVNSEAITSGAITPARYDSAGSNPNPIYPTGVTLYEELAWLASQMYVTGQSQYNKTAIQEAIWTLTSDDPTAPHNQTTTATGTLYSTSQQSYSQWITNATNYYNTAVASYITPNYNNWLIITDSTIPTACTPVAPSNTCGGKQEFIGYISTNSVGTQVAAPEPASFALFGSALLGAALLRRRYARNAN